MSLLSIEHLRKIFADTTPLEDVSVNIEEGEIVSVIGPSGTGKSTLLRCVNRLVEPTSGKVVFDGETITDPGCDIALVRRKMGMVFQQYNLFANRNVIENIVSAPIKLLKQPKEEAYEAGTALLQRIGLANKAHHYPDELSGGQQQRVAIARAVAMRPKIMLFDEPTSALDPTMVAEVLCMIRDLARTGMTMLIVTHEMRFARDASTRVLYMDEGGIYEDGTPEQIFEHSAFEKTRRFIYRLRTLQLTIDSPQSFGFYGTLSDIERFGMENMMPPAAVRKLQLAFEEIVLQNVIPHLDGIAGGYPIRSVIEYSEADESSSFSVRYGGDCFDPMKNGDPLGAKLVRGIASKAAHTFDEENCLSIEIGPNG